MRTFLTPLTRAAAGVGLGAFALYMGGAIQRLSSDDPSQIALLIGLAIVIILLGSWSLAYVGINRLASVGVLVLAGLAPLAAALSWFATGDASASLNGILWANLLAGLATSGLAGWMIARGPVHGARRETRVARV